MFQVIFLLNCLVCYVALPVLRFPAETQPWAGALAWVYVMIRAYESPRWRIGRYDLILVALTTIMMVYIYPHGGLNFLLFLRKSAVFLFSVSIVFLGRKISPRALWIALTVSLAIYVFFGLLQIFANHIYKEVALPLVPLQDIVIGKRGVSSLCPEATDFGLLATYMLFFALVLLRIERPPATQQQLLIVAGICGLCVLSTESGSGIISSIFMLGAMYAPRIKNIRAILAGGAAAAAGVVLLVVVQPPALMAIRGFELLSTMMTSPDTLIATTTFSYRFMNNLVGLIALINSYGLGYGSGAFPFIAPKIYTHYGLGIIWNLQSHYFSNVYNNLNTGAGGVIPMILVENGIVGLALIFHLAYGVYKSKFPYRWAALLIMLMAWLESFPVAWPPFWLVIGLALNPRFAEAVRRIPQAVRTAQAQAQAQAEPQVPAAGGLAPQPAT